MEKELPLNMGFLNKLMFWKKEEDDFDFDHLAQKEAGNTDLGLSRPDPFNQEGMEQIHEDTAFSPVTSPTPMKGFPSRGQDFGQAGGRQSLAPEGLLSGNGRDLELINSKLDTLKALLNSIDQRLANLEKNSLNEQQKQRLW